MNEEKVFQTLRKLQALAERGVGGEKETAIAMLKRLMRKHGIKAEEIGADRFLRRRFEFTTKEHKLFVLQCIASVIGTTGRSYTTQRGKRGVLFVELTTAEHLECIILIDHYWKHWVREREIFYDAFIQSNRLFAKREDGRKAEPIELSPEELARIRRMMELMNITKVEGPTRLLERREKLNSPMP